MKDERNNLGRQYTSEPNFGTTYPNTQYKGYAEHEASSFGTPSRSSQHTIAPGNQYGYTSNYQGNNPNQYQSEPQGQYLNQYSGQSWTQGSNQNTSQYTPQYGSQFQSQLPGQTASQRQPGGNLYQSQSTPQYRGMERSPYQGGLNQYQGSEHGQLQSGGQEQFRPIYQNNTQWQGNQNQPFQGSATIPGPAVGLNTETQGQASTGPSATISPVPTLAGKTSQSVQSRTRENAQYNDRDRVRDLMLSEKHLAEGYNISSLESMNPQLHSTLKELLNDTHSHQETLNRVVQENGWSKMDQADQQLVSQAYQRFLDYKNQFPF